MKHFIRKIKILNKMTLQERVNTYIDKKADICKEYKAKLAALNEEASKDILKHCTIKAGDVYVTEVRSAYGCKTVYYKVASLTANVDGTVAVYGQKRRQDNRWGKRNNCYMFTVSVYDNYRVDKSFEYIKDYVDAVDDIEE
jgi:hypothetical protein